MKIAIVFAGLLAAILFTACQTETSMAENSAAEPTAPLQPFASATAAATATVVPPTVTSTPKPTSTPQAEPAASAANADVLFVKAKQSADGTWRFDVTVAHPDTGWDDYADGWDVVLPDGSVVKVNPTDRFTRLLVHPHETEQPFTRSQSGIRIPADVTTVTVRAHDLVDGWGGKTVAVDLSQSSGEGFEVQK